MRNEVVPYSTTAAAGLQFSAASQRLLTQSSSHQHKSWCHQCSLTEIMTPEKCLVIYHGERLARAGVLWGCPKARGLLWSQALHWTVRCFPLFMRSFVKNLIFIYLLSDWKELKHTLPSQSGIRKPIQLHDFFWICD